MTKTLIKLCLALACSAPLPAAARVKDSAQPGKRIVAANDGLKIVCEVRGQGNTALVFLHGGGGDRTYWKHQVDMFSPDYRIVTVDQAGTGESGKDRKEWTVTRLAVDVESVVKALDLRRVILIGHSMSGSVSLAAAKRMPGRVIAVVGVDTLQNAEIKVPEETAKQILDGLTTDFKGALRAAFAGMLPEQTDPELMKWLLAKAQDQDQKMSLALIRNIVDLDLKVLFMEAKVPIRCINSAGGYQFFTPTTIETNRKYADYNAVFIENVGHYPMLEKPAEFNQKLHQTLRELSTKN